MERKIYTNKYSKIAGNEIAKAFLEECEFENVEEIKQQLGLNGEYALKFNAYYDFTGKDYEISLSDFEVKTVELKSGKAVVFPGLRDLWRKKLEQEFEQYTFEKQIYINQKQNEIKNHFLKTNPTKKEKRVFERNVDGMNL